MNYYRLGTLIFIITGSILIGVGTMNAFIGLGVFFLGGAIVTAESVD